MKSSPKRSKKPTLDCSLCLTLLKQWIIIFCICFCKMEQNNLLLVFDRMIDPVIQKDDVLWEECLNGY